jgi:hypothetical protein
MGRFTRPGSILGQRRYLLSCITKGFPTSANLESNHSVTNLKLSAKNETHKSSWICCYSLPRCNGSNAKTLWLKYLQFPDMGVGVEPPDRVHVFGNSSDKLHVQRNPFPLFRRGPSTPSLCRFFLTWSIWIDQASLVSRITPRQRTVSTEWICCPKS